MVDNVAKSAVTPSIITSGSLAPVSDVVPRTRTADTIASWLPLFVTCTPAACPLSASSEEVISPLFIRSSVTLSMAPATISAPIFE